MKQSYIIYTDGACWPNPGPGGWAAIVIDPSGKSSEYSGGHPKTTNNRMEIMGALEGLKKVPQGSMVNIYTDSKYLLNGASTWMAKWKLENWTRKVKGQRVPVKNMDLWKLMDYLLSKRDVHWTWVRGHDGNDLNERADQLVEVQAIVSSDDPRAAQNARNFQARRLAMRR
jgi:ribonuclease HI